MQNYDVVVIGGGVGGGAAALNLSNRGYKVAIIEQRDWGGTTINRGSTSKRALLATAQTHYRLKQLGQDIPPLDWSRMMSHCAAVTMAANQNFKMNLIKSDITTIEGHAEFVDDTTVSVHGELIRAQYFIIATGARPRVLDFDGNQYMEHSASFLKDSHITDDIVIVGAGIIAFALASIASEAGIKVTMIQHNQTALRIFDRELVDTLIKRLKSAGVTFEFDTEIERITKDSDQTFEVFTNKKQLHTKAVYCVTGRIPNVEDLNLANAGVHFVKQGIEVNDYLMTSNPHIFAVGDCCNADVPKLSNYATFQGKYLGESIGKSTIFTINYPIPALCVFSIPKLGQVGISVQKAQSDPSLEVKTVDLSQWQTYARIADNLATLKLVVNKSSQKIVGAEVLSQDADQLIDYLALLMQQNITADNLSNQLFAYPSQASDLYGIWQSK